MIQVRPKTDFLHSRRPLVAEGTDTVMILDSSEEEDEQEAEEEERNSSRHELFQSKKPLQRSIGTETLPRVQEPIDFAAEAAKTAARSLARSASQTYTKTLLPRCIEASSDPELQAQQLKALEAHADRHPEMARAKPAQPPPAPPASSPHSEEAQKPVPVASQDAAGETSDEALVRTETTLMIRSSPKATFNSSSLTRLPSGTWRGPVESSGNDREMFLRSLSKHESMPLITFRPRRGKDLWVTNVSNPAPDTYPCLDERLRCTSKYEAPRQVSFGFSRKGSRWPANAEQKPGPGAHSLVNFERFKFADPVRHSFGGAPRCRPNPIRDSGPGPGAYGIQKSADEEGPAVTMTGKFRKRGVLNYDDPGPGAYDPSDARELSVRRGVERAGRRRTPTRRATGQGY
eukprot:g28877.t1